MIGADERLLRWMRSAARAAFALGVLLIVYLSLNNTGGEFAAGSDKLHHFLAYFAVSGCGFLGLRRQMGVAGGMIVLGIALEIAQGALTAGRSADVVDALANALGVAGAFAAVRLLPYRLS